MKNNLMCYERYEAAMEAAQSALRYEGDGLVSHEDYDRVKRAVDRFETAWNEDLSMTRSPFPFRDGGHSYFLS